MYDATNAALSVAKVHGMNGSGTSSSRGQMNKGRGKKGGGGGAGPVYHGYGHAQVHGAPVQQVHYSQQQVPQQQQVPHQQMQWQM